MKIRPSTLPQLAESPCYEPGPAGEDADRGTARHLAFKSALEGNEAAMNADPDADAIRWAVEQVKLRAPTSDYPLELEVPFEFPAPGFGPPITGRLDVQCGPVVLDLKWRWFDYSAQMAAYAMRPLLAGHPKATVFLLFAESQRVQELSFTLEQAESVVYPIVERAIAGGPRVPGQYCGWCVHKLTCPALLTRANAVAAGREDWEPLTYHPSEVKDAAEMGKLLSLARQVGAWAEGVEYHAKELAQKDGIVPAGYKLQSRQGNRFITSVADAFPRCGLPQAEFLGACEVKLSALAKSYATFHGLKAAPAERECESKLGDLVQRKPASISLVKERKPNAKET